MADMANIVLKDRSGDDVTYAGVSVVNLPTEDGGTYPFYALNQLNAYLYRHDRSDYNRLYIIESLLTSNVQNRLLASFTDVDAKENGYYNNATGTYSVGILYTPKKLVTGMSYAYSEISY
jgi:hypothetical protein